MHNIVEVSQQISKLITANFSPGVISVAHNHKDTIYIYEHVRGLASLRTDIVVPGIEHFKVIRKYIGKIKPA